MKEVLKLALALGLTCFLAGSVLVFANLKTADAREAASTREKLDALAQTLGEFANRPIEDTMTLDGVTFYLARNADGKVVRLGGAAVSAQGFGGDVTVLVALEPGGTIHSVLVTEHKETPGLGTNATDRRLTRSIWSLFGGGRQEEGLAPNPYLDRFSGQQAAGFDALAIDGITGATISSRAVAEAVQRVCDAFARNQEALLKEGNAP